jgi:hypothetical protein
MLLDFSSQEGQTYVGREDASTEQDIGETINYLFPVIFFNYYSNQYIYVCDFTHNLRE